MKNGYAHIALLLDESGSMESIKDATLTGFNKFIKDQKELAGDCTVSLATFNSRNPYALQYEFTPLAEVKQLRGHSFRPDGGTPLLRAMATHIDLTGRALAAMKEEDRPDRVLLVVLTDGEENSSRDITWEAVAAKIKHQEEVYGWKVVYLGANQDAIATGGKINICHSSTLDFQATPKGTQHAFNAIATGARLYRSCVDPVQARSMAYFADDQRTAATPSPSAAMLSKV